MRNVNSNRNRSNQISHNKRGKLMINRNARLFLITSLITTLILSACAPTQRAIQKEPSPLLTPTPPPTATVLSQEDFPGKIAKLQSVIESSPDKPKGIKAHLELADLYIHWKNPNRDYGKALEELKIYISLNPDQGRSDEVQNRLTVLEAINKLFQEISRLKIILQNLKDENESFKTTIEQLKNLELQLEEKRKSFK